MKISGFSYIRNGFTFDYPFLESIQSILPICDEFVIAVGDSNDGTREAIVNLNSPKIRIIDTIWDMNLREGGKIFAQQTNIALDAITGHWGFHIQADEVIHEKDLPVIEKALKDNLYDLKVEGFLFKFLHFYGSYDYIINSRRARPYEVRIIRNNKNIRSYLDSQGFRMYPSIEEYEKGDSGRKLNVKKLNATIYHYSKVRPPEKMQQKIKYFHRFWHTDQWIKEKEGAVSEYDYSNIDALAEFKGTHPTVMKEKISNQNWYFKYDKSKTKISIKNLILDFIERKTGYRLWSFKNYKIIR